MAADGLRINPNSLMETQRMKGNHEMHRLSLYYVTATLAFMTTLLISGCGKSSDVPVGRLSGIALVGDAPFSASAVLMFLNPKTGDARTAPVTAEGTFEVDEPMRVGTYIVYLAPPVPEASAEPVPVKIDNSIPEKYWNESSSDLKVTIDDGDNKVTLVFEQG